MLKSALYLVLLSVGCLLMACPDVDPELYCSTSNECFKGYGCDVTDSKICVRECTLPADCLATQVCTVAVGQTSGLCQDQAKTTPTGT